MTSIEHDIITLLEELGFGQAYIDIYDPQTMNIRDPVHGILVEQRNTSPVPDVLNHTDTTYVNLQVKGPGKGEKGKAESYEKAMRIYRALNLVLDRVINDTLYLCITPDSAPYSVQEGSDWDYIFGIEITRYYGE